MGTSKRWRDTVRATPRAVRGAMTALFSLAFHPPASIRARQARDRIARHLDAYHARLLLPPTVHILQWTVGGVPGDPEVFRTAEAAGTAMARYVRETAGDRHPFVLDDGERDPITLAQVEAGEVGYLSDESGDRELRLWEAPILEVTS